MNLLKPVVLFSPPARASLRQPAIGGNGAEGPGGPRAFKYVVTRHYVLGVEAVLPTGEQIRAGGWVVKNVVGYDLTQLLVGSEGTLAILTKIILRLIPKPPAAVTLRAMFPSVRHAVDAVGGLLRARVIPAALELIDRESLDAVAAFLGDARLAPAGTNALLLIEMDGLPAPIQEEATRVEAACRDAGATDLIRASGEADRQELWRVRRELSPALRTIAPVKVNHDVVVPRGRIPDLFVLIDELRTRFGIRIPSFGHVGDGNIHVNIMVGLGEEEAARAREAEELLFRGVVALGGSISGEHGIGFAKAKYLGLELTPETIALMKRIKHAFDPHGILNPGKIFPDDVRSAEL
jgi:glycolate oxidase